MSSFACSLSTRPHFCNLKMPASSARSRPRSARFNIATLLIVLTTCCGTFQTQEMIALKRRLTPSSTWTFSLRCVERKQRGQRSRARLSCTAGATHRYSTRKSTNLLSALKNCDLAPLLRQPLNKVNPFCKTKILLKCCDFLYVYNLHYLSKHISICANFDETYWERHL